MDIKTARKRGGLTRRNEQSVSAQTEARSLPPRPAQDLSARSWLSGSGRCWNLPAMS